MPSTSMKADHMNETQEAMLRIEDLRVQFAVESGDKTAVDGISLSVAPQGSLALVGESGSGKSVSMRSVLGLLPRNATTSGSAVFTAGDEPRVDLLTAGESRLRSVRGRQIGMVFQNAMEAFNPSIPIGNQLMEALLWHRLCDRSTAEKRIVEALGDVGIPAPERKARMYPFQLSGGMRQRAMIAMATVARPHMIIADEPTTALDVTVQKQILELLKAQREAGMGMIMITHDLAVARYVCDDAVVLRQGQVVEKGPVIRLLTRPREPYSKTLIEASLEVGGDVPEAGPEPEAGPDSESDRPVVQADGLTKRFASRGGEVLAVDDVSFSLDVGRTLAVVGESGSGKSTLARLTMHLIEPTSGQVVVDGEILGDLSSRRLRRKRRDMQMVFQSPYGSLLPSSTVSENIEEPLRINKIGSKPERRARAAELLELVKLDTAYLDMYPRQLSGGQQQRVAIARALALQPKYLVADEPTSALDASVQMQVLDLLRELQDQLRFSMMLITHNLAVAERLADEVMVMKEGRIHEFAPTSTLFDSPEDAYTRRLLGAILPLRAGLEDVS